MDQIDLELLRDVLDVLKDYPGVEMTCGNFHVRLPSTPPEVAAPAHKEPQAEQLRGMLGAYQQLLGGKLPSLRNG